MNLPKLKKTIDGRKRQRATTFNQTLGGYNHNLRTKAGEFYDMENISLDNYPVIGTRQGFAARYLECNNFLEEGRPGGIHEYKENTLMVVFGSTLHVGITADSDGEVVRGSEDLLSSYPKTFATIGKKTLIMPDKVIYDLEIVNKYERLYKIEAEHEGKAYHSPDYWLALHTLPCDIDGVTPALIAETGIGTPPEPTDGMWWYNAVASVSYAQGWYEVKNNSWVKIEKSYTKLVPVLTATENLYTPVNSPSSSASSDLNELKEYLKSFKIFDTINIDGNDFVIYGKDENSGAIVISHQTTNTSINWAFTLKVKCPELEHIFSLNNRIWGFCPDSREIFACKLGDPTQWYNYAGVASDSFAVSLGNDKEVTAGCSFNNMAHFFTEDTMIKIYGDYPSNYQMRTFDVDGVVSGGSKTLVQVEGLLFWVSPIGVEAYEGSLPYLVGQEFEPNFLTGKTLAAGKDGTKYCLSVAHLDDWNLPVSEGLFAFDTQSGMWAKMADNVITCASELKNALCYVNENKQIVTLHERNRTTDWSRGYGENVFITSGRSKGGFILDDENYVYPIRIENDGSGEMEYNEEDDQVTGAVGYDGVVVETLEEYWNDPELSGKEIGVGVPVKVTPGKKYAIYYTHLDGVYGSVYASERDADNGTIGGWTNKGIGKNLYSGESKVMPAGTEWLYFVFCRRLVDGDIDAFDDLFLHEIPDPEEEPIEWSLETGNLGLDTPDQKYISRVQMRIDFFGSLNVDISYDDSEYLPVHVSQSDHMRSITVPVKVRRCDHFNLKLSGTGQMRLYSLGYETDEGSARCLL